MFAHRNVHESQHKTTEDKTISSQFNSQLLRPHRPPFCPLSSTAGHISSYQPYHITNHTDSLYSRIFTKHTCQKTHAHIKQHTKTGQLAPAYHATNKAKTNSTRRGKKKRSDFAKHIHRCQGRPIMVMDLIYI